MSFPDINAGAPAGVPAASAPAGTSDTAATGRFGDRAAEIVSSGNQEEPAAVDRRQQAAWLQGEKPIVNNHMKMTHKLVEGARQLQADQPRLGRMLRALLRPLVDFIGRRLGIGPSSRPADASAPDQVRLESLSKKALDRNDLWEHAVYENIRGLRDNTAGLGQLRSFLQQEGNRDNLEKDFGKHQHNCFAKVCSAADSAAVITQIKDAGASAMKAGHPYMDRESQQELGRRIDLGSQIISKLATASYVPENESLRATVADSNLYSFSTPDHEPENNPYMKLLQQEGFGPEAERHLCNSLVDAVDLLDQASRLVIDSSLGRETQVDEGKLLQLAGNFGITGLGAGG